MGHRCTRCNWIRKTIHDSRTLELFAEEQSPVNATDGLSWPDGRRFPLNLDAGKVQDVAMPNLRAARSPLIVSGYASLDRWIDFVTNCADTSRPRLLVGHEPYPSFLNFKSQRTQHLLRNMADHVLLFTATPINKIVIGLCSDSRSEGVNLQKVCAKLRAYRWSIRLWDLHGRGRVWRVAEWAGRHNL